MFTFLATYYPKVIVRYFKQNSLAKILTASAFFVVIGGFAVLVHEGFYYGFLYVARDAFFGEALSFYLIELFLLASSFLMFASALVNGTVSLFRNNNDSMVMASPRYILKPVVVALRMFFTSLWPLLVIIIPALIAIVRVFPLSWVGFILALLGSVFLALISVLVALLIIFSVSVALNFFHIFLRSRLIFGITGFFLTLTLAIGNQFQSVDLVSFFQARLLEKGVPDFSPILDQFSLFPSHLVALIIYHGEQGVYLQSIVSFGYLAGITVFLATMFYFIVGRHLLYWQIAEEHSRASVTPMLFGSALNRASSPNAALFFKEFVMFFRDVRGMLWLGFILLVWGIQTMSSYFLVHGLGGERVTGAELPFITTAIQYALITYFISMLALRFVFPTFSTEKHTGWIMESSPISLLKVFYTKLYFFSIIFSLLAFLFITLNTTITGITLATIYYFFVLVAVSTIFITTLALSLGAIFPNSETDDPEALSTTLPGLVLIICSLGYGGIGATVFYFYLRDLAIMPLWIFVIITFFVLYMIILFSKKSLNSQYVA